MYFTIGPFSFFRFGEMFCASHTYGRRKNKFGFDSDSNITGTIIRNPMDTCTQIKEEPVDIDDSSGAIGGPGENTDEIEPDGVPEEFQCGECGLVCSTDRNLRNHMISHEVPGKFE